MSGEITLRRIAIIGFGEAGGIFGEDLAKQGVEVTTYDILLDSQASRPAMLAKAERAGVRAKDSLAAAIEGADLVLSAVTAQSAADVARAAGPLMRKGQIYLDINSVAPATKRANAEAVEAGGADYVESAVMAPVPPHRIAVPMLFGGAKAEPLAAALRALGMNATAVSDRIGVASAIKMCRSIVIKGLEALTLESMFAARRFGAEKEVLASLQKTFPHMGWEAQLPDYLISRVAEHGRRRAAEMREVARTLADIGLDPVMASATAVCHDRLIDEMAEHGISYRQDEPFSWRSLADALSGNQ